MSLKTLNEVAQLLKVSKETVYRLAQSGKLRGAKVGRSWRFTDLEISRYLESKTQDVDGGAYIKEAPETSIESRNEVRASSSNRRVHELMEALDCAHEKIATHETFFASVIHEVRTPMNAIIGMLNLTLESKLDSTQTELVTTAKTAAESLLRVVNDVLDFSKLRSGKYELEFVTFRFADFFSELERLFRLSLESRSICLVTDFDPRLEGWVVGDPQRLRQVLINLVANSIKFTRDHGVIVVHAGLGACIGKCLEVEFYVSDSGSGVGEEQLGMLLHPFHQASSRGSASKLGTGLGLSVCAELVRCMGGSIEVKSKEGVGTNVSFRVRLLRSDEQTFDDDLSETCGEPLPSLKILVADDNRVNQVLTSRLLEKMGHQVVMVDDGWKVLETLHSKTFDLILMDVHMPNMDGIEACREIRNGLSQCRIPIVALTATASQQEVEALREVGVNDVVLKPVKPSQLVEAIRRLPIPER